MIPIVEYTPIQHGFVMLTEMDLETLFKLLKDANHLIHLVGCWEIYFLMMIVMIIMHPLTQKQDGLKI